MDPMDRRGKTRHVPGHDEHGAGTVAFCFRFFVYSDECVKFLSVPSWNEVQSIATIGIIDASRLDVFVLALL